MHIHVHREPRGGKKSLERISKTDPIKDYRYFFTYCFRLFSNKFLVNFDKNRSIYLLSIRSEWINDPDERLYEEIHQQKTNKFCLCQWIVMRFWCVRACAGMFSYYYFKMTSKIRLPKFGVGHLFLHFAKNLLNRNHIRIKSHSICPCRGGIPVGNENANRWMALIWMLE